jgi:hypothetical protein
VTRSLPLPSLTHKSQRKKILNMKSGKFKWLITNSKSILSSSSRSLTINPIQTSGNHSQSTRNIPLPFRPRISPQHSHKVQHHRPPMDLCLSQASRVSPSRILYFTARSRTPPRLYLLCVYLLYWPLGGTHSFRVQEWLARGPGRLGAV